MECSKCAGDAVMHAAYSGQHLCEDHFLESVDRRVRRRIRQDHLLDDPTPGDPVTWVIGLSGGKDSVVLTRILHDTFAPDPRVRLVALTVHEGIEGYRDDSLTAARGLLAELDGIDHEVVTYAEEFGVEMDRVVEDDPLGMAACAYCGVFRRDVLDRYAQRLDATLLFTGHNLDDETQTALMNLFQGDVRQIAKHYDASLAPLPDRTDAAFVPRVKPLRDVPEKEVALYAHLTDLPVHAAECPHATDAYRGEIQRLVHQLEDNHPGTRHSVMAGYEDLARLAAAEYKHGSDEPVAECEACGAPTSGRVCRACELVTALSD